MKYLFPANNRKNAAENQFFDDTVREEETVESSIASVSQDEDLLHLLGSPQCEDLLHLIDSNQLEEDLLLLLDSGPDEDDGPPPREQNLPVESNSPLDDPNASDRNDHHPVESGPNEVKLHPFNLDSHTRRSTMSNLSALQGILQTYVVSSADIQGAVVVTLDGLALASVLPNGMDEEKTAAMSAAMLSLGERIGKELARGAIDRVFVQGDTGYGVLTSCGSDSMLLTLASKDAKQGMLFMEIKQMNEKVSAAMGSAFSLA